MNPWWFRLLMTLDGIVEARYCRLQIAVVYAGRVRKRVATVG
jgi:hypothetical protein